MEKIINFPADYAYRVMKDCYFIGDNDKVVHVSKFTGGRENYKTLFGTKKAMTTLAKMCRKEFKKVDKSFIKSMKARDVRISRKDIKDHDAEFAEFYIENKEFGIAFDKAVEAFIDSFDCFYICLVEKNNTISCTIL